MLSIGRRSRLIRTLAAAATSAIVASLGAGAPAEQLGVPGLQAPVTVYTDTQGTPHIVAESSLDLSRAWGYVMARDRFFQMDLLRRTAAGRRGELLGAGESLGFDAQLRPMGLHRAAARDEATLSPNGLAELQAFAEGVNSWLTSSALPREYTDLEITEVPPWVPTDTFAVLKLAGVQFSRGWEVEETDVLAEYRDALGDVAGPATFLGDIAREQPVLAVPADPNAAVALAGSSPLRVASAGSRRLVARAAARWSDSKLRLGEHTAKGSNAWAVADRHTSTAGPIVAGDNHDSPAVPNVRYEIHVAVAGGVEPGFDLAGIGVPGVPFILHGHNGSVAWASTASGADDADYFSDRLVRSSPSCPERLCIVSDGEWHPVIERTETFHYNEPDNGIPNDLVELTSTVGVLDPLATHALEVPFRSFGRVIEIDDPALLEPGPLAETEIITMQWTGAHAANSGIAAAARTMGDVFEFREALRGFPGKQNWVAADSEGNIAYIHSGELPLRADLEQGFVHGNPLRFVRDGSGPANWLPDPLRSAGQSIPYRVVPFDELPQAINPAPGYVISANHDHGGETYDNDPYNQPRPSKPGAILHIGSGAYWTGMRAGRIRALLDAAIEANQPISVQDVVAMQGNSQGMDAELIRPYLTDAFGNAQRAGAPAALVALGQDPEIAEAVSRIAAWDLTAQTGVPEGWDFGHPAAPDPNVPAAEAEASVATTLYAFWRVQLRHSTIQQVVDALGVQRIWVNWDFTLLMKLLGTTPFTGLGATGLDYFQGPVGLGAEDRRDWVLLQSMRAALDELSGPTRLNEFEASTDQDDYRWGRLHRLQLPHPMGEGYSIPTASGFDDLSEQLPGLPVGSAFFAVNTGQHPWQGDMSQAIVSSNRIVMSFDDDGGPIVWNQMAGPAPGDPNDPRYGAALERWLTGTPHRLEMRIPVVASEAVRTETLLPAGVVPVHCAPAPLAGCTRAGKASVVIDERRQGKEKITAVVKKLADVLGQGDFGDPITGSTHFGTCLYDDADVLVGELGVDRAGDVCGPKDKPCWVPSGKSGYRYKDTSAESSGVRTLHAKGGAAGKGLLALQAGNRERKGQNAMPTGMAARLLGAGSARLQLVSSDGSCFEALLGNVKKSETARFKAKAP